MTPTHTPAWLLMRALDLLRRISERISENELVIQEAREGGQPIVTVPATVDVLKRTAAELFDDAAELEGLVASLPDGEIRVTRTNVQAGAAAHLADGILDVRTAALAASMLPVDSGWRTLAIALQSSEAHTCWTDTTVAHLLGRFRGAKPEAIEEVLRHAHVDRSTPWPDLPVLTVVRLAEVLAATADRLQD